MGLTLVAGPIGNLGDLSPRAAEVLREADVWYVEDTRVSGKLQAHLGVRKPMHILNEHTSPARVFEYADAIAGGQTAALLTDAGTPAVSDPGAMLVEACHERGVEIDGIPGPSAVTAALMVSGFFAQRFAFLGYLPRKAGAMREELRPFADSPFTLVLFESPHRLDALMAALADVLGSRRAAICRELTKIHQQIYRVRLPEVPSSEQVPRKGEFTIVVEGIRRKAHRDESDVVK